MRILVRNLLRRKLRTVLTVGGIVIGVFALTVMGAMSEKLTQLVKGGERYYETKVIVVDGQGSAFFGGAPMTIDKQAEIERVDGVAYASPEVSLLLNDEQGVSFGTPQMIVSSNDQANAFEAFKIKASKGRLLTDADRGKVVVGSDLVGQLKTGVGETVKLRNREFEVIGVLEKTLTAPDNTAIISLADAQEMVHATLPDAFKSQLAAEKIVSNFAVYLDDVRQGEEVAKCIQDQVSGVKAYGPSFFKDMISQGTAIFNLIILSGALIAIIVGGFSIMNTLTFAVIERTREIGIKKAVGARSGRILREFLLEAAAIGLIGGVVGILLGWAMAIGINLASADSGLSLFLVTPKLILQVFVFSIVISVAAGYLPARRASKLHPVEALRYE